MKISITDDKGTAEVFKMRPLEDEQLGCAAFFAGMRTCHCMPCNAGLYSQCLNIVLRFDGLPVLP